MGDHLANIPTDAEGTLVERGNRFLAVVDIYGIDETASRHEAHVHDPGRLEELLYPGNRVLLRRAGNPQRKTRWDVIAALHDDHWILIHSGYHREISTRILEKPGSPFGTPLEIRPEVTVGHSRLDFMLKDKDGNAIGVEVKGCTLAVDGVALFPDAPTVRGRKHVETLIDLVQGGSRAGLLILVFQPGALEFSPNEATDPAFAEAFWRAMDAGVEVHIVRIGFDGTEVTLDKEISVQERS
jgi:sugar fermentation stimulation protein A